ncbi:MAG: hypothetical protein ACD_68C00074G0002 [uncultured bacterium]|nr:MAG: hypothetical protein ACD_68C00074G0002 [uncultured bacterium]
MNETILTDANFEQEVLKHQGPVLVDFFAPWCGPCQMMVPVIEDLAKENQGKIKIAKMDIDENPDAAQKYQILSIPTSIVFVNGEEKERSIGAQTKSDLQNTINKFTSK